MLTEADKKRLKLMGISKQARHPMFNGRRKECERRELLSTFLLFMF